jgi:hypothetical protein
MRRSVGAVEDPSGPSTCEDKSVFRDACMTVLGGIYAGKNTGRDQDDIRRNGNAGIIRVE